MSASDLLLIVPIAFVVGLWAGGALGALVMALLQLGARRRPGNP